jgi:hypothetical protein
VNYVRGDKDRVTVSYWALPSLLKVCLSLLATHAPLAHSTYNDSLRDNCSLEISLWWITVLVRTSFGVVVALDAGAST